jgi:hypothetical protein
MLSHLNFFAWRELQPSRLDAPKNALMHHVVSFRFKAHPRFLEAASFAWPTAKWRFNH